MTRILLLTVMVVALVATGVAQGVPGGGVVPSMGAPRSEKITPKFDLPQEVKTVTDQSIAHPVTQASIHLEEKQRARRPWWGKAIIGIGLGMLMLVGFRVYAMRCLPEPPEKGKRSRSPVKASL